MKYQSLRLNESLTFRFLQSNLLIIHKGNTFSQISYHNGDNHLAEKLHSVVYTEIEKLDLVQQLKKPILLHESNETWEEDLRNKTFTRDWKVGKCPTSTNITGHQVAKSSTKNLSKSSIRFFPSSENACSPIK